MWEIAFFGSEGGWILTRRPDSVGFRDSVAGSAGMVFLELEKKEGSDVVVGVWIGVSDGVGFREFVSVVERRVLCDSW
jgi:hypothetical protein